MGDAADNEDIVRSYRELVEGVHMVRRAAERAVRAGVLPTIELHQRGITPLQECEAVARVLYTAAQRQSHHTGTAELAGLNPDEVRPDPDVMNGVQ